LSTDDLTALDDGFGHWLAGFTDGEGSFQIHARGDTTCVCTFAIALRIDDRAILEEIQRRLGIGRMSLRVKRQPGGQDQAQWSVSSKREDRALVDVFERYPLRAKKARDFAVWAEAVKHWSAMSQRGMARNGRHDWTRMQALRAQLIAGRAFDGAAHPPLPPAEPDWQIVGSYPSVSNRVEPAPYCTQLQGKGDRDPAYRAKPG
jgi:hypothetical protein